MLISLARALPSSSVSVGNFIKHLPPLQSSLLKFNSIPITRTVLSLSSASNDAATASAAVDCSNFQTLSSHQKNQVRVYIDSLLQWNQKMNLTAVKEENEVMERHVEDSLSIIEPVRDSYLLRCGSSFDNLSVVDVGSGAGLPGVVLAIACPGWKEFPGACCWPHWITKCANCKRSSRGQNVGQNLDFRENFDIAVARAVAEMRVLAEYCLPLVRVGGLFVAAKGHDPQEEVANAERAISLMGASLVQTCLVESHSKYGQRTAIICRKDRPTPRKYPWAPGTPSKLPL